MLIFLKNLFNDLFLLLIKIWTFINNGFLHILFVDQRNHNIFLFFEFNYYRILLFFAFIFFFLYSVLWWNFFEVFNLFFYFLYLYSLNFFARGYLRNCHPWRKYYFFLGLIWINSFHIQRHISCFLS